MGPSPPETSPTPHHLILNEHIQTRQTLRPKTATITSLFSRLFGTFAAPSPAAMSAAKTKAQGLVNENAVVVFSKSWCPFCKATKDLLSSFDAKYKAIELDQLGSDDGDAIQSALQEISSQRTVPNVFIQQKHVGGNSDLQARKGELPGLLKEAGAV